MRHVDEGTLHELLDGSLRSTETVRVEAHLAGCGACRIRLEEARALVRDTADLILALDTPAAPSPPSNPSVFHRPRWFATFGWAASITIAVGIGFALRGPTGAPAAPADKAAPSPSIAPGATDLATPIRAKGRPRNAVPAPGSGTLAVGNTGSGNAPGGPPAPAPTSAAPAAPEVLRMHPNAAVALDPRAETGAQDPDSNSITLEDAVQRLGGSIRLIDGLDPVSVTRVPGSMVEGADPRREAVLVKYLDPALGAVLLAQQRVLVADSLVVLGPVPAAAGRVPTRTDAAASGATHATFASVSWKDGLGFRLTLSAAAPPESLAALKSRVR